jgi:hypothetical protein
MRISRSDNKLKCMFALVTSLWTFGNLLPKKSQHDLVLIFHEQDLLASKIYERLVDVFAPLGLASSIVTKAIRPKVINKQYPLNPQSSNRLIRTLRQHS